MRWNHLIPPSEDHLTLPTSLCLPTVRRGGTTSLCPPQFVSFIPPTSLCAPHSAHLTLPTERCAPSEVDRVRRTVRGGHSGRPPAGLRPASGRPAAGLWPADGWPPAGHSTAKCFGRSWLGGRPTAQRLSQIPGPGDVVSKGTLECWADKMLSLKAPRRMSG